MRSPTASMWIALWSLLAGSAAEPAPAPTDLKDLSRYVARLEAVEAAKHLQYLFGYYQDSFESGKLVDLFAEDAVVDYAGGKYVGRASIARLFERRFVMAGMEGRSGFQPGIVNDHYLMQGVMDPSDDGASVMARFRDQIVQGQSTDEITTAAGLYEVRYTKQHAEWKIASMVYCEGWRNKYTVSLNFTPLPVYPAPAPTLFPADPAGPDRVSNYSCHPWPYAGITPPMHYPHPVTGDYVHKP